MKTWQVIFACALLGLISGISATMFELGASPVVNHAIFPGPVEDAALKPGTLDGPHSKVVVDLEMYDAGNMQRDVEYKHRFVLQNKGDSPLRLKQGETSCKCTMSKLVDDFVPPDGQAEVELSWKPFKDGPFGQRAEVFTNDPKRPRVTLSIKGRVISTHAIVPDRMIIGSVSVNESQQAQVQLRGYRDDLKIDQVTLADAQTSTLFDVHVSPMAAEELKADDPDAKIGFLVHLTVKPGLPLGPIHQTILLHTNLPTSPLIEIPVDGAVTGGVSVYGVGFDFNAEQSVLSIGTVKRHEGVVATMLVRMRGAEYQQAKLKVIDVSPSWLKVSLGEVKENAESSVANATVTVEVPENSKPTVLLGPQKSHMGSIRLQTGMPSTPELKIYLSFAIED